MTGRIEVMDAETGEMYFAIPYHSVLYLEKIACDYDRDDDYVRVVLIAQGEIVALKLNDRFDDVVTRLASGGIWKTTHRE